MSELRKPTGFEKTKCGKFLVRFKVDNVRIYVGTFDTEEEAKQARQDAYIKHKGTINHTDISGKRFGKLTAIKYAGKTKSSSSNRWLCQCDCGNTVTVVVAKLNNKNTQSCGCYKIQRIKEVFTKGTGVASFNKVLGYYKANAKRKNLNFELTDLQFKEIVSKSCNYCGIKPSSFFKKAFVNGDFLYNGIDRKDNNQGYTLDNSLTCCSICNRAKSDMSYELFVEYLKRIYNYAR